MTLAELCQQMPRTDADADLKRRGAEVESWLRRWITWGRSDEFVETGEILR